MPTQRFRVHGLQPDREAEVVARVRAVPGVLFAVASAAEGWLEAEFDDDHLAPDDLRAVLESLGYSVRLAG